MIATNKLYAKIVECGFTKRKVATMLNISPTCFYNRINKNTITVKNIDDLKKMLNLTIAEVDDIFFNSNVA